MAILDRDRNAIVLRIVYDGPASAGKTTSVRSLGESLGRPVSSPEEAGERTLFFDWLDYTGGRFEGYQLRCQVVTVPGQALLARRRAALLRTADSVVYVSSVTAENLASTLQALANVPVLVDPEAKLPVGIVLQANKRDLPSAIPRDALRDALERAQLQVGIVESTATTGSGIREAFVFGVRLALDRVREQMRDGTLAAGSAAIDSAAGLHGWMLADEIGKIRTAEAVSTQPSVVGSILGDDHGGTPRVEPVVADAPEPSVPDGDVLPGLVWPPIEGRMLLSDAVQRAPSVTRVPSGWAASTDSGWKLHSPLESVFDDVEAGRTALVRWARLHVQHQRLLSAPRCISLAVDGHGRHRLWQAVRVRPSIRERLAALLDERDPELVAGALVDASFRLADTHERLRAGSATLPITLDTVGIAGDDTVYVGLLPVDALPVPPSLGDALDALLEVAADWRALAAPILRALGRARFRTHDESQRVVIGRLVELFADLDRPG